MLPVFTDYAYYSLFLCYIQYVLFRLQSEQLDEVHLEMEKRSLKRSIFMTTKNLMTKDIIKIGISIT